MSQYLIDIPYFSDPTLPRVVLILALVVVINLGIRFLLYRLERAAKLSETIWDDALIEAAHRPVLVLSWVIGLAYAARVIHQEKNVFILEHAYLVRDIALIACGAWFLFRLINSVADNIVDMHAKKKELVDRTTIDALSKLGRFAVIVISLLMVMQVMGFSVSGVLAFGGLGGIAVGFAAKDLLANFFGGLTIYMDRPFVVGESIRSAEKAIEGEVEHIGWRLTRIRSLNKSAIYVPNALFTTIVVENITRITHRRINETIGLRYVDMTAVAAIVSDIKAMLSDHPSIDNAERNSVNFDRFADSSLSILITAFTEPLDVPRFADLKQRVLLQVADIVAQHGAEMAFPTQTVLLENALHIPAN
ncbi:MAG: mechanosensitive ion channel family protein [Gallionellaceae bacterium]|nr:mechanosensitive ion channel family protein [Gallionellaceae bacterium]